MLSATVVILEEYSASGTPVVLPPHVVHKILLFCEGFLPWTAAAAEFATLGNALMNLQEVVAY